MSSSVAVFWFLSTLSTMSTLDTMEVISSDDEATPCAPLSTLSTPEVPCRSRWERFCSSGLSPTPKGRPQPKPKGRPMAKAVEGGLDLGEKRPRSCRSKKEIADEQKIREMERRLELLETVHAQGACSDEKVQQVLS